MKNYDYWKKSQITDISTFCFWLHHKGVGIYDSTILENIEKIFFLKTTELNEPILCMNDHWMVSY